MKDLKITDYSEKKLIILETENGNFALPYFFKEPLLNGDISVEIKVNKAGVKSMKIGGLGYYEVTKKLGLNDDSKVNAIAVPKNRTKIEFPEIINNNNINNEKGRSIMSTKKFKVSIGFTKKVNDRFKTYTLGNILPNLKGVEFNSLSELKEKLEEIVGKFTTKRSTWEIQENTVNPEFGFVLYNTYTYTVKYTDDKTNKEEEKEITKKNICFVNVRRDDKKKTEEAKTEK